MPARMDAAPGVDPDEIRRWLAALHGCSDHPVARPFWRWAADARNLPIRQLQVVPGRGLQARIFSRGVWRDVRVGNQAFMESSLPAWLPDSSARRLFVRDGVDIIAVCELTEAMRPSAEYACRQLSRLGWHTAVITGDASIPDDLIKVAGECHASQQPEEKARIIMHWQHHDGPVLYLGDGPNDAPALAAATASIAIDPPADWVNHAAQASWPQPDLAALPGLLADARQLATTARRVLQVSIIYNLLGMAVAAAGLLHPVAAALIMFISSATVVHMATRPGKRPCLEDWRERA